MFTYADADCDGRIRYWSRYNERCFPRLSPQIFSSWSEFQTMIIPQPVGGVGVSGGGAWAQAVTRPAPGPAPCTLSVSGLARVAPSGNPLVTSHHVYLLCQAPGAWPWAGRCRHPGSRWAWRSLQLSDSLSQECIECYGDH